MDTAQEMLLWEIENEIIIKRWEAEYKPGFKIVKFFDDPKGKLSPIKVFNVPCKIKPSEHE